MLGRGGLSYEQIGFVTAGEAGWYVFGCGKLSIGRFDEIGFVPVVSATAGCDLSRQATRSLISLGQ